MECDVIKDLMPLYKEGLLSDNSKKIIEEHIRTCKDCADYYQKSDFELDNKTIKQNEPLVFLNNTLKKDRKSLILMIGSFIASILLIVFAYMSKPIPIDYSNDLISISTNEDKINLKFDGKITRLNRHISNYEGKEIWYINGYTTKMDKKGDGKYIGIEIPKNKVDIIAYSNNGNDPDEIIYDPSKTMENGGTETLPRLVLAMYAILALAILLVTLGLSFTILKKKSIFKKIRYISIPFSYLLATFAIKGGDLTSNYLTRDLIYIAMTSLAIYLFIYSISLYFERKENIKINI